MSSELDADASATLINMSDVAKMTAATAIEQVASDNFNINGNVIVESSLNSCVANEADNKDGASDGGAIRTPTDLLSEATKAIGDVVIGQTETTVDTTVGCASQVMQVAEIPIPTSQALKIPIPTSHTLKIPIPSSHALNLALKGQDKHPIAGSSTAGTRAIVPKLSASVSQNRQEQGNRLFGLILTLPCSDLKFKLNDMGNLEMINDEEMEQMEKKKPKLEAKETKSEAKDVEEQPKESADKTVESSKSVGSREEASNTVQTEPSAATATLTRNKQTVPATGVQPPELLKMDVWRDDKTAIEKLENEEAKHSTSAAPGVQPPMLLKMDGWTDDKAVNETQEIDEIKTCINCGKKGLAKNFIRQGRYCSKSCATIQSTHLRLFTTRNTELVNVKDQSRKRTQQVGKKVETGKMRKIGMDKIDLDKKAPVHYNDLNEQNLEEFMDDTNEDVEETEAHNFNLMDSGSITSVGTHFLWRPYLNQTNSIAAPLNCFKESQLVPLNKNGFKVGMKLEGIDPQHPSKFCVLSVAEVCGFRIRLHFDGYKELFDFWVNADSPFIFPVGWCDKTGRNLEPPLGMTREDFNWNSYLQQNRSVAAPKHLFKTNSQQSVVPNGFRIGMKLEAVDKANAALVCVATITDIIDNWLLIHFDGWDDSYDYWCETTSPYIHAVNWCRAKGRSLTPPKGYHKSSERFCWEEYLQETKSMAVSPRAFKTIPSNLFKIGMKIEAVDKRNPKLIRVATISHRQSHSIKIHFDGWDEKYDYWVDDDSPDIHPALWCHKTGHPLTTPPSPELFKKVDANVCSTPGCNGSGHIRGPKYASHYSTVSCPYTDSRLEYELPDRLGNPSGRNSEENCDDECFDGLNLQSNSPTTSESNLGTQAKQLKPPKKKSRKRKLGLNININANVGNGSVSPSTNSEKHSRPSTPSSSSNVPLHHPGYVLRLPQQHQDAPICWDKHTKVALPGIDQVKSNDVLLWTPMKVAEFVDAIPGCHDVGQVFHDELIDGEAFLLLNQNDMVKILRIKLGPAIKIFNTILLIRDKALEDGKN